MRDYDSVDINDGNCFKLTGYTFEQILSLTGIRAIHSSAEISDLIKDFEMSCYVSNRTKVLTLDGETSKLKDFYVRIFLHEKFIINERFYKKPDAQNVAIHRIYKQVITALELGFEYISTYAFGFAGDKQAHIGHIIWAKYGFLMANERCRTDFHNLVKSNNRKDEYLHNLICEPTGLEIWKKNGTPWQGVFHLDRDKLSIKILNSVLFRNDLHPEI